MKNVGKLVVYQLLGAHVFKIVELLKMIDSDIKCMQKEEINPIITINNPTHNQFLFSVH